MKTRIIFLILALFVFTGCAELLKILQSAGDASADRDEVISGLKEALTYRCKELLQEDCQWKMVIMEMHW